MLFKGASYMRNSVLLAGLVLAGVMSATSSQAAYIYSPNAAAETTEGNTNNVVFNHVDSHDQWIFDSSIFGSTPVTISDIAFRFDSIFTNQYGNAGTFSFGPAFHLELGALSGAPSSTFDDNLTNSNAQTVMSGSQAIPYVVGAGPGQLKPFGVVLNFTTPFVYNPAAGNLLIDLYAPGQNMYGTFDFVTGDPRENRVFNLDASSPTGSVQDFGPVVRFDVAPASAAVPEPAAWSLMIAGFALGGLMLRRRKARLLSALA